MRAPHGAAPHIEGRRHDVRDPEPLEGVDGTDDIDNRVERPHFVQMHALDRRAVDGGFRLREPFEQLDRAILAFRRQRRPADGRDDVFQMVMRVRAGSRVARLFNHPKLRSRNARAADTVGRHLAVFNRQAAERAAEPVERQPEIQQRAKDHVPRCAGETVEDKSQPSGPYLICKAASGGSCPWLRFSSSNQSYSQLSRLHARSAPKSLHN